MLLRLATLSDADIVEEYNEAFSQAGEEPPLSGDGGGYSSWFVSELERRRGEGPSGTEQKTYLLLDDSGGMEQVLGHMMLDMEPKANLAVRNACCIEYAVRPDERGKGCGTSLLSAGRFILQDVASEYFPIICHAQNVAARRTIEKNGCVFVGEFESSKLMRRKYYCTPNSKLPNNIVLKDLS